MDVYVVQHAHEHEPCGHDSVYFIGVYSTLELAEAAVERLSVQPGFRDLPEGFCISRYPLDKDHWCEGFVWGHELEADPRFGKRDPDANS